MLKMMTYKKANKILNSFLKPNNRCITRGVGDSNGADQDSALDWINSQGYQSSDFPSNRLMPAAAIENPDITLFCYIPFDDLVMKMDNGQDGYIEYQQTQDPNLVRVRTDIGGHEREFFSWTGDSTMAGYTYQIDSVHYEDSSALYGDGTNDDWLYIETLNDSVTPSAGSHSIIDGHPVYSGVMYYAKVQPLNQLADTRRARVIISAQIDSSLYNALVGAGYVPATNVCSKFAITIQQSPANDGPDHTGATLATLSNTGTVTLTNTQSSTANGANVDFALMFRSLPGYSGYWTKAGYIGTESGISNQVQISETGSTETITINLGDVISYALVENHNCRFFVFGTWAGAIDPQNGNPPKSYKGGIVNTTVSDGIISKTISKTINTSGNLSVPPSQPYATTDEVIARCTCLFEVKYDSSNNTVIIKEPDSDDSWNLTGIDPVFYPVNFTWDSTLSSGLLSRVYEAKAGVRQNTTIQVLSTDDMDKVAYRLSINDQSDNTTYTVTVDGDSLYLSKDHPLIIESNIFQIDFSSVESGSVTKRFKLQQYIPAERPRIHDGNASPEYAEISFTFQ